MAADTVCTLVPYFKVNPGQLAAFKAGAAAFVERTSSEKGCAGEPPIAPRRIRNGAITIVRLFFGATVIPTP